MHNLPDDVILTFRFQIATVLIVCCRPALFFFVGHRLVPAAVARGGFRPLFGRRKLTLVRQPSRRKLAGKDLIEHGIRRRGAIRQQKSPSKDRWKGGHRCVHVSVASNRETVNGAIWQSRAEGTPSSLTSSPSCYSFSSNQSPEGRRTEDPCMAPP